MAALFLPSKCKLFILYRSLPVEVAASVLSHVFVRDCLNLSLEKKLEKAAANLAAQRRGSTALENKEYRRGARARAERLHRMLALSAGPLPHAVALEAKVQANMLLTDEELECIRDLRGGVVNAKPPSAEDADA